MPELDTKEVTFHYRGIPTTLDELAERETSNRDMIIFSPQRFGVQTTSKAFD
jgi:hypothetical protein